MTDREIEEIARRAAPDADPLVRWNIPQCMEDRRRLLEHIRQQQEAMRAAHT